MLPELFQAEENGLIIELPCKPGETWYEDKKPTQEIKVSDIMISKIGTFVRFREKGNREILAANPIYFTLHYSKSREAAEKRLESEKE